MVDFAAHFTIHATKIGFKNGTFYLESVVLEVVHLPIVCQSESSLRYFHLGRISNLFSIHREKIQGSLVVEKSFSWTNLKYGRLKNSASCPKLNSTHQ